MAADDIEALLGIEQENPSPWSRMQLIDELQQAHCWSLGAKVSGDLVGYVFCASVADEAEVRKIAVHEKWRRQGIASLLLDCVFKQLRHDGVLKCFLELRVSNLAALKLYMHNGFYEFGRRKSYYKSPVEDAIVLQKVITSEEH